MTLDLQTIDWNSVAALASAASLVFLVLNLAEMRTQRRTMYKPKVALPTSHFFIEARDRELPNFWIRLPDNREFGLPGYYQLEVLNVGFAAALEATFTWRIDFRHIVKDFEETCRMPESWVTHGKDAQYFYRASTKTQYGFLMREESLVHHHSVIDKQATAQTNFPEALFNYICYCLYEQFRLSGSSRQEVRLPPRLGLLLQYYDLGKKRIVQRYDCNIDMVFYRPDNPLIKRIAVGTIEFAERK